MKKKILIIMLVVFPLIINGCASSNETGSDGVEDEGNDEMNRLEAIVKEVDEDGSSLFVEGVGEENALGDEAIIDISRAEIVEGDEEKNIADINEGDRIAVFVDKIAISYPAQASTEKVIILESEKAKNGKVFIREGREEITIRSENVGISNLSLYELEYDSEKDVFLEKNILNEEENIEEGKETTWEVVYSEGIPNMKLSWKLQNGEEGEYIIAYDGKDGIDEDDKLVYPEEDEEDKEEEKEDISLKDVKLYFIFFDETDEYLVEETHSIKNVEGIAKFTLENLRDIEPKTEGAMNPIYKEAKIEGISINDGIAKVNFSKEIENTNFGSSAEALQVNAIVNTLTQFPTIEGVVFNVGGKSDVEMWLSHIGNVDDPFRRDLSVVKGYKID